MLAEDSVSDAEIAAACGVTRPALQKWKAREEFQTRIAEIVKRRKDAALRYSIAQQDKRIADMDDRWRRMRQLIDARAEELNGAVPGGETGLLVRQIKLSNTGIQVEEFAVDTGLLKEMRALEEQVAKELGQYADKPEAQKDAMTTSGPVTVTVQTVVAVIPQDVSESTSQIIEGVVS